MDTARLNSTVIEPLFDSWIADLERRHLAELTFPEVARALRALSSTYVERRDRIAAGAALSGAGKRAAFALFYGPLHFLVVHHVTDKLGLRPAPNVIDLGCGTGAAGAAFVSGKSGKPVRILGIDRNPWALGEAARTYRHFGAQAATRQADAAASIARERGDARGGRRSIVAAFTINELADEAREALLTRILNGGRSRGDTVLIVEPIAKGVAKWWGRWAGAFEGAGGTAAEWRFAAELPGIVAKLDRAAGLDHRELTARSLSISRSA